MAESIADNTHAHAVEVERVVEGPLDLSDDIAAQRAEDIDAVAGGEAPPPVSTDRPVMLRRAYRLVASVVDWLFGAVTLIVALAVLATIPLLNLLSLGYLLAVSGRVAESGRLRDGFLHIRKAAVIGRIVICSYLVLLPVLLVSSLWESARLIDPSSPNTVVWRVVLVLMTVAAVWHIAWAIIRGGKVVHFLWPAPVRFWRWVRTPNKYATMRDAVYDFVVSLGLPRCFWLGARGFVGTVAWLILPVGVLIVASQLPPEKGGGLLSIVGGLMLAFVVMYLPFLQTHFAREDRFAAMFEWREVRRMFTRAPIAWWTALVIMLLFALPLYLLKIELTPREVAWLPSLVFVMFIFPARLLAGWAVGRSYRREEPRHWVFRWTARLGVVPVVFMYALIVYMTQYISWYGTYSLLEQHAFLVPAPMLGL